MVKYLKSSRIYTENGLVDGYIEVRNGKISKIYKFDEITPDEYEDFGDSRIIPGIIDVHNHGYGGWSMSDDIDESIVRGFVKALASIGVTAVLPTANEGAFGAVAELMEKEYIGAKILGIHSEGPFWARGGEHTVDENYPEPSIEETERLIELCQGKMRMMAIAPEVEGAHDVIRYLNKKGILVAAAHTKAYAEDIQDAMMQTKIDLVTHLGNGMRGIHHRNVGALGAFLLNDNLYYEIIADLNHICADMLKIMFKLQPYDKFLLISDSNFIAGLGPGEYVRYGRRMYANEYGLIKDEHGRICGSGKHILYGMQQLVEKVGVPMYEAVRMASLIPARFLGIDDSKGSIAVNKDLDIVVIDDDYNALVTYIEGEVVYDHKVDKALINYDIDMYK